MLTEKNFIPSCQAAMKMNSPLDEIMDMEHLVKNVNKAHRTLFPHLYEEKKMNDDGKRTALIGEEYENICEDVGLVEEVIEKYKSDLANIWVLHCKEVDTPQKLWEEFNNCILLEAEARTDNVISGGE